MRIDAHQHYWHPARGDYHWMPKDNPVLHRPYGPADLHPHLSQHGIDGTVLVQAAATVEETAYMLGLADATPSIKGVVGWVDFEDPAQFATLIRLAKHPKFLGVRPMIQDIPDVNWMLRDDIQWAFQAINDLDLTLDALGLPKHLETFRALLARYPDMRVVCDHIMKPEISKAMGGQDAFSKWAAGIEQFANDTKAVCKLSGMVTEAHDGWGIDDLRPFANHVLEVFGPARIMWGSDWPVCRLQAEYTAWLEAAQTLTAHLPEAERTDIFGGTAARFYRLA